MKREIKFRAWNKTHKWMDNEFSIHADGCIYQDARERWDISDIAIETAYEELEIMQFTGLKDNNGEEIFDGDIVMDDVKRTWLVKYSDNDMSFVFCWGKDQTQQQTYKRFLRVQLPLNIVGNIYENAELL